MNKKKTVLKWSLIGVAVVAIAAVGIPLALRGFASRKASAASSYQVVSLTQGDLSQTVKGSGTVAAGTEKGITVPFPCTIDEWLVEVGQDIKAGEPVATVTEQSLTAAVATIQEELDQLDSQIASAASAETSTGYIKATVAGRVKQLAAEAGSDVSNLSRSGGLMVISTDGKMRVETGVEDAAALKVGEEVVVTVNETDYDGVIEQVADALIVVTLTDDGPAAGAKAAVSTQEGTALGSGTLAVNQPVAVLGEGGTISKVYVEENDTVYAGQKLAYVKELPASASYASLVTQRAEKAQQLALALDAQQTHTILAEEDGVLSTQDAQAGLALETGAQLMTVAKLDTKQLTLSVDELDIASVAVGQEASVALDALPDTTFTGEVTAISALGTSNSGVTSYPVTVEVADPENQIRIGMNATATLTVEESKDALLLPLTALQSVNGESYVWLYTGELPTEDGADPGIKTVVETGLSNDSYVEIKSGLTQTDQVVVVRTAASTDDQLGMMGGFGGMNGEMPQMEIPQDGNGGRPEGFPGGNGGGMGR